MSRLYLLLTVAAVIFLWLFNRMRQNANTFKHAKIYIGNLHYRVRGRELYQLFESMGEIESLRIIKDKKTGRSKGYAFLVFASTDSVRGALKLNGSKLRGRALVVRTARER